ncbi:PEP-CTERM sorting domain-containing protein [Marinobacter lipolyticus]|uniref:PEP-CTERM sorting domain-containing protein n=1 Tax=Marinobacter lipolyticus TaxID=209639 RepID=UPI001BCC7C33|nr:PEP-CTERM sorting domain-containing protein [Marinobacter lipolyticus]MBS8242024.1 PEP-CTERM sorting domain-containing protein [Marinobacter lipolyticus]
MKRKTWLSGGILATSLLLGGQAAQAAMMTYDTWETNENDTGNYIFQIDDNDAGLFNYNLTVDPWNAEALGLFLDFGTSAADASAPAITGANVSLFGRNQASDGCGAGCNLNGLAIPDFDGVWSLVFRLGAQGFDNIQTFSWSSSNFGLSLEDLGVVGIRAQQLCSGDATLDNGDDGCGGSDKAYGSATTPPNEVPEPGTLALIALGLLAIGVRRWNANHKH